MKTLLLIGALLFSATAVDAQDIFFPSKEGTVLEYKIYDSKDEQTGMTRYTITDIKRMGSDMDITYLIETTDSSDKELIKQEITINKKGDKLYVDMSKFISNAIFEKVGEKANKMKITGNDMEIPSNIKVGDNLPDSNIEMALKMGFINIKISANITDRKVESAENIVVEAGNFNTYKLTKTLSANAMGMKTSSKSAEWIAKGVGMVKSETYDNNGDVSSYTELVLLKE